MSESSPRPRWVYLLALAALVYCLWLGWSGVDLYPSQESIREAIRSMPRRAVQIAVQDIGPWLLLGFLLSTAAATRESHRRS